MGCKSYGSVNGQSKEMKIIYGSLNSQSKKLIKLYGSVGGQSKLIYEIPSVLTKVVLSHKAAADSNWISNVYTSEASLLAAIDGLRTTYANTPYDIKIEEEA